MASPNSDSKDNSLTQLKLSDLKSLCLDNDLKISGTKSELIERLISSGLSEEELGITSETSSDNVNEGPPIPSTGLPDGWSMEQWIYYGEQYLETLENTESEELIDQKISEESEIDAKKSSENEKEIIEDDEGDLILDSEPIEEKNESEVNDLDIEEEIIEADLIEEPLIEEKENHQIEEPIKLSRVESDLGLINQLKEPKVIVSLIVCALLLGAGFWYMYNQPKPFTPDQLRYGDEMKFIVTDGILETSGEDLVTYLAKMLGAEDKMCGKLNVEFTGIGTTKIFQGGAEEISGEPNQNLLGTIRQTGPYGEEWLTVQKELNYELNDVDIETNTFAANNKCSSLLPYFALNNYMSINTKIWNEAQDRSALKTSTDYTFNGAALGNGEGSVVTYGVSGLGGVLSSAIPGIDLIYSPVILHEFLDGSLIEQGSSGEKGYWKWQVSEEEEVSGEKAWKIIVENDYVVEKCIGHARATLWATEESPWPIKQIVDVQISTLDEDRTSCDKSILELGAEIINPDFEMPQGRISLGMQLLSSELISGTKLIQWSSYNQRPFIGSNGLSSIYDWNQNRSHIPDLSQTRTHTLEKTIDCLTQSQTGSSIVNAIQSNGYIWNAKDNRSTVQTKWNLSWIDTSSQSGWALVEVSTTENDDTNCVITRTGVYDPDESPEYNKQNIPMTPSLMSLESRAMESNLFPELSGNSDGLIGDENGIYADSNIGYNIFTPSNEIDTILNWLERSDGAVTFEINRNWVEGGNEKNVNLLMDGTDGRILGWAYTSV